jgi:Tfp pilus assembly protein PilF
MVFLQDGGEMAGHREKPDFVVDPSGSVHDVRHSGYGSSEVPPGRPSSEGDDSHPKPHSSSQPKRTIYLIPIPIGLIIFLVVSLIRYLNPPEENPHTFDSEGAYAEYNRGNRYFFSGEYDMAVVHFNMALSSESDVGDVYNSRGLVYRAKGEHDRALADFDQALGLMPDSAMVYNNRAITYQDMGDYDQAIADLTRAIELQPNLGKAYYNRGLAYLALSDYERAIADLDAAIERSSHWSPIPTSEAPDSGFGLLGGFGEELEATRYAAPLPLAHYNRGLAYLSSDEYSNAIADLRKAVELQPDLSAANYALTLAYAAVSQTPSAQASPGPASTGTDWSTATARALSVKTAVATPTKGLPAPVAVYVPQLDETPTTPIWESAPISCGEKPLYMWSSPGKYIYRITDSSGAEHLVVEQKTGSQGPISYSYSCALLEVDITSSASNFGESLTEPPKVGNSRGVSNCRPPRAVIAGYGAMSTVVVGIETKRTHLGAFQAVRLDTNVEYSFTTGLHDTFDTEAQKSEWYACGYGLVHSTASSTEMKNRMTLQLKSSEVTLVSYTPISTNESHVRHILVDLLLGNNIDSYRAKVTDEETAEALRRWEVGIRVVNVEEFEREMISGQWEIVYAGTRNPIIGTDVILTTDSSR